MIVDDDVEMRTLLAEYFRRLGFEVAEKENAALALQAVTTDRFDCFILDVAMPEMSGIELLKKLRERGIDTPTLFLTAHDLLDDKVAGFEAGADDYLAKPFSPRELEYRVEALLRRGQGIKKNGDEDRLEIGDLVVDRRLLLQIEHVERHPVAFEIALQGVGAVVLEQAEGFVRRLLRDVRH